MYNFSILSNQPPQKHDYTSLKTELLHFNITQISEENYHI